MWAQPYKKILAALSVILLLIVAMPLSAQEKLGFVPEAHGAQIPNLQFTDDKGQVRDIADLRGKLVLLNIWATWCPPCRAEMPGLSKLQAHFPKQKFQVVPIAVDYANAKQAVQAFYSNNKIDNLPVLLDPAANVQRLLNLASIPVSILIAPTGRILGRVNGDAAWDSPEAINLIKSYLSDSNATEPALGST